MRKFFLSIFTALLAIGFVGCEYDDSALWGEVNSLKDRVLTLEQLCQQMNTNISSLQSLVSALQNQDYITSVTPIKQGNDVIGYTITFAKGEPITIYHGQDGKNGADGEDGKDGYTPVIGVDKDEDGVYYWTLDGEWLTDAEGNKIPTSGKDGADGEDGEGGNGSMPELKIQGGYWYVSYDGGENWERLGRATGYDGTDGKDGQDGNSVYDRVIVDDDYVTFILEDGTTIVLPRQKGQESLKALEAVANNGGKITLTDDVELDELLAITTGKTVTINLNGHNITGNTISIKSNGNVVIEGEGTISSDNGYGIENAGTLTINGATINSILNTGTLNFVSGTINNQNAEISGIQSNAGSVTLGEDVKITSHRHAMRIEGGSVVINGGTYTTADDPNASLTQYALNVGENNAAINVTIKGGTFTGPKGTAADSGGAVNVKAGSTVTIEGGSFVGGKNNTLSSSGTLTVSGGTFDQDPSAYVADGYHAIEQDGVYCVVPEGVGKYVEADSIDEIKTALESAGAAGAGSTVINLANGTYDMTNVSWTSINVDGYHGADIVYVNGNGAVIKGLTSALFAGGFAGGSGIVIKDLTIEDAVMSATNTQGYGAFVNCADSMDEITLENCHLINSTIITPNDGAAGSRIGGLVGWTAGYGNQNDGPVDSYITIKNCSVIGCTLKGAGSIGAICGHAGANAATFTTIEDCVIKDNKLISTDTGSWRVGVVVGTANNGQCDIKNITESGNVLEQTGKTAPEGQSNYYGRFVPAGTGTLTIDGVAVQ